MGSTIILIAGLFEDQPKYHVTKDYGQGGNKVDQKKQKERKIKNNTRKNGFSNDSS